MNRLLLVALLLALTSAAARDSPWYGALADADRAWNEDRWGAAEAEWRRAVSYEAFAKVDPEGFARTLGRLGTVSARQSKHTEARDFFARALPMLEAAYGVAHPEVVRVLIDLASSERQLGNLDAAEQRVTRALGIIARSSAVGRQTAARAFNTLGNVHAAQGRDADALPLYRKSADLIEAIHGSDSEELGTLLVSIGETELELDRPAEAERALEQAARIASRNPDAHLLDEVPIQLLLGDALERERYFSDAKKAYTRAIGLSELRGPSASGTAFEARRKLGALHLSRGEYASAVAVLERALKRTDAGESAVRAVAWVDLGRAHEETGNPDAAIACYQRAVEIVESRELDAGQPDANLAVPLSRLGHLHRAKKDPRAARVFYAKALGIMRRTAAPDDPDIGSLEYNLGAIAYEAKQDDAARSHFQRALHVWQRGLPMGDARVDKVRRLLGELGAELPAVGAQKDATE